MKNKRISRREFIHDSAVAAAGVAVGLSAMGSKSLRAAAAPPVDTSKILNYNENMRYRRLGKTDLMVSACSMGGHMKRFDVMNQDLDENRYEVISRCIDVGINYIDACWDGEVIRDAKALKGRRDKMYLSLSHGAKEPRQPEYRTAKKLLESLDELLMLSKQEYTDLWRITLHEPGGRHSFNTCNEACLALEMAKQQGKARFGGFSTHDHRFMTMMIRTFPQIDVLCFPYFAKSKALRKDSLLDALEEYDVGAFGIKPFSSNFLFKGTSAPDDPNAEEDDRRARMAIRYVLASTPRVIPIPGLINIHQVDNVVKAVMERTELDLAEHRELDKAADEMMANLSPEYQWLKDWEYV